MQFQIQSNGILKLKVPFFNVIIDKQFGFFWVDIYGFFFSIFIIPFMYMCP